MDKAWQFLTSNAANYGFLGPIVGIVGLLLAASAALTFGWSRASGTLRPPTDTFPDFAAGLVSMLTSIGVFVVWLNANTTNGPAYIRAAIYLAIASLIAFLVYVWLWYYCGRFKKPRINNQNVPDTESSGEVIWGGFYLWHRHKKTVAGGATVDEILSGNTYDRSKVWPPGSIGLSMVVTALVLITLISCGTIALATAGASIQVALTGKAARLVFSSDKVPGLSDKEKVDFPDKGENKTNK